MAGRETVVHSTDAVHKVYRQWFAISISGYYIFILRILASVCVSIYTAIGSYQF